jgi:predicted DNA-binding transcriptional regulator AlpA
MEQTNRQPTSQGLPVLVNEDDIAAWLGVTSRTILNWTKRGKLPQPVKLGKVRAPKRWLADDVSQWIREQAQAAHG